MNKVLPFCPRATAEGMAGPGSAVHNRFLTRKRGREFYGFTVRVVREQVLYLSAGGPSNRKEGIKGQKEVRKTTRAANSGPCPKDRDGKCTPRSPQGISAQPGRAFDRWSKGCRFESGICKAKECTASGKKINLLFCNMNTCEGRKPTREKVSSKCNSKRRQSLNPARKNVPKGNL